MVNVMRIFLFGAWALLLPPKSLEHTESPLKPPVIEPISRKAPAFAYRSLDGHVHTLAELKGKAVLINFWGTWCPGCVQEMPTLQRLYDSYSNNPKVAFVIVSWNDSPEKVRGFVKKGHFTMPIYYLGTTQPPKGFDSGAWPATYFVSPGGTLRGVHLGGSDWSDPSVRRFLHGVARMTPTSTSAK